MYPLPTFQVSKYATEIILKIGHYLMKLCSYESWWLIAYKTISGILKRLLRVCFGHLSGQRDRSLIDSCVHCISCCCCIGDLCSLLHGAIKLHRRVRYCILMSPWLLNVMMLLRADYIACFRYIGRVSRDVYINITIVRTNRR